MPISSPGIAINQAINVPAATIAALAEGPHMLVCRVRDSAGVWAIAFARGFHKYDPAPETALSVSKIEYRWYQNSAPVSPARTLVPSAPGSPISFAQLAALAGLSDGQSYQIVFTPYDQLGRPGFSETRTVEVQTTDSNGDGIPDLWAVNNGFGINEDIVGKDDDTDGLTNLQEFLAGSNPRLKDSDGDGLDDRAELELSALGFDPAVRNDDLVATLQGHAATAGLYTKSQMQGLALGQPLLERDAATGRFKLSVGLKKSPDLKTFTAFPLNTGNVTINPDGDLLLNFTASGNTVFFRLEAR